MMIGKFAISGTFTITYNYTAELFPTVVRTSAVGMGSIGARITGALTPFVALLVTTIILEYIRMTPIHILLTCCVSPDLTGHANSDRNLRSNVHHCCFSDAVTPGDSEQGNAPNARGWRAFWEGRHGIQDPGKDIFQEGNGNG